MEKRKRKEVNVLKNDILVSVIMPTYNTPEEYLKTALQDDTLEIKKLEVSDQTFYYVERPYSTEDGIEGMVIDGVLDGGDKFVCMILDTPKDSQFNLEEIIK